MLFLARADQGEAATGLVRTPVAAEVGKTIEFFEFILDDMRLAVDIEGDTRAEASLDTARFRRAVTNLLQNAIQHTECGRRITVRIEPRPEHGTDRRFQPRPPDRSRPSAAAVRPLLPRGCLAPRPWRHPRPRPGPGHRQGGGGPCTAAMCSPAAATAPRPSASASWPEQIR